MKKFLKSNLIIVFIFIILNIFGENVEALTVETSSQNVSVGDKVTITIPFEEKVSAVQFKLDYDKDKLTYSSYSCDGMGFFAPETNKFAFAASRATLDKIIFTFIAKSTGTVTVGVSDYKDSNDSKKSPLNTTITIFENSDKNKVETRDNKNSKNIKKNSIFSIILLILFIIIIVIIIKQSKKDKTQR